MDSVREAFRGMGCGLTDDAGATAGAHTRFQLRREIRAQCKDIAE